MNAQRPLQIAYFVHGRGRGHGSRALSIVPKLRMAGHEVHVFASGQALAVVQSLGPVGERPLLRAGLGGWLEMARRFRGDGALLKASGFQMVIADGDQAALLAARRAKIPSIAVGHDLVFSRCHLPSTLPTLALFQQRLNSLLAARISSRRVAVNFLPANSADPHTWVSRPELEPIALEACRKDQLLCYFRDKNGQNVTSMARNMGIDLVGPSGEMGGRFQPRDEFRRGIATSRGVVASAGSNVIAECVLLRTPLLALYRKTDSEQALNGRWMEAEGIGTACSFETFDQAVLRRFWKRAGSGEFRTVNLAEKLPPVSESVLDAVDSLLQNKQAVGDSCAVQTA